MKFDFSQCVYFIGLEKNSTVSNANCISINLTAHIDCKWKFIKQVSYFYVITEAVMILQTLTD